VWTPVRNADGTVTVAVVAVPGDLLHRGVTRAWLVLAGVGVLLLLLGVALADRLGRSMVRSVEELGHVTRRLQAGDFDARVEPSGPPEVEDVGHAVNELAVRIGEQLAAEREAAADISHRLRTPLAALRLEAEGLTDVAERERLGASVEQLTEEVSEVIREARRPRTRPAGGGSDLVAVAAERLAFWSVLAEDQGRPWTSDLPDGPVPVAVPAGELVAAIDALLANVFGHTPEATAFHLSVRADRDGASLTVRDDGPGFPPGALERGRSGAGSTGLGLDIARRTAERAGGGLHLVADGPGAVVELRFGAPAAPR
jgi:signal transduction histidine kinase